jgi:lysozyme family protein
MAQRNWQACLTAILNEEGGFADNPGDPGGATNMGITRKTLSAWRGEPVSREDVMMLEKNEAARIYREKFWMAIEGDDLPDGLDLVMFDDGVLSGPRTAIRDLQQALGVRVDGLMGPVTRAALLAQPVTEIISLLQAARLVRLKTLPHFVLFGRGWSRRLQRIERQAKALAKIARAQSPAPPAAPTEAAQKGQKPMSETQQDTKPFWASQTIWSSIAVIGSSVTGALLAWKGNDIAGFGAALTALLGGVNAIVGRVRASTPIA